VPTAAAIFRAGSRNGGKLGLLFHSLHNATVVCHGDSRLSIQGEFGMLPFLKQVSALVRRWSSTLRTALLQSSVISPQI
jgi:hypothetical protein